MDINTRQLDTVRDADIDMDMPDTPVAVGWGWRRNARFGAAGFPHTLRSSWRQWGSGWSSSAGEAHPQPSRGILERVASLRHSVGLLRGSPDGLTTRPLLSGGMLERMVAVPHCRQRSATIRRHLSGGGLS
eukprot:scaffold18991_cov49-Phaeocystis_antarctica.AAC.3